MKILELGSGANPTTYDYAEVTHLDKYPFEHVEVVHDLEVSPLPFENNEYDLIISFHTLEHIANIDQLIKEMYRITRDGGVWDLKIPHYSESMSPFHKTYFDSGYFYWYEKGTYVCESTGVKLVVLELKINFYKLLKPVEWVVNINRTCQKIWEKYFKWILPAYEIHVVLGVNKK